MRKFLTPMIALALLSASPACAQDATKDKGDVTTLKSAEVENANVFVSLNGLVCDFCSIALNKTFKKQKAVDLTHVDLDSKMMAIRFKSGQTLDDATIKKLVKKAGYTATSITRVDTEI